MTYTERYVQRVEKILGKTAIKKDLALFASVSKLHRAGILYQIAKYLDNACTGRKAGRKIRHQVIAMLVGMYVLEGTKLGRLQESMVKKAEEILVEDSEKHRIQKIFPENTYTAEALLHTIRVGGRLSGLLIAVVQLGGKDKNKDLLEDTNSMGECLTDIGQLYLEKKSLAALSKGNDITDALRIGFLNLRQRAEILSLAATMKPLPGSFSMFDRQSSEMQNIVAAINRFPVKEEVTEEYAQTERELQSILIDITDLFVDYPMGDIRKAALRKLNLYCRKYSGAKA